MPLPSYDIDFRKLIKGLLARLGVLYLVSQDEALKRIGWLRALLKPIENLHSDFLIWSNLVIEDIKWNGQTIILQTLLIEKFGLGIYILSNEDDTGSGFFLGDGPDVMSYIGDGPDVSSFIDEEYSVSLYSFTVYVPAALVFSMAEMKATIDRYNLYGFNYNIVIV